MKKCLPLILAASLILGFAATALAADAVDLTGKQGVVDPNDLKKYDPKPAEKTTSNNSGNSGSTSNSGNRYHAPTPTYVPGHGSYGIAK